MKNVQFYAAKIYAVGQVHGNIGKKKLKGKIKAKQRLMQ